MMKKQIIIFMFTILLVGTITAGISLNNRDLSLSKEQKSNLESINLKSYNTIDYELNGKFQRCLSKEICSERIVEVCDWDEEFLVRVCNETLVNDCKSVINKCSNYMDESLLDDWEKDVLINIAEATEERKINDKTKVSEGVTNIK